MVKKIAIIGAGVAGLTLANFLKKNSNFEFMIYEKEDSLSLDEGYGIQLAPNSIKILNEINFNKIKKEKIFHPQALDFYSIKNEKICNLNLTSFNSDNVRYTTLQRSTLIEFLKDEIYNQHLRFGKRIKEVSELKGKILIKFDDNTNDLVDHVIGADGIFSNTRNFFEKKKINPSFQKAVALRLILKSKPDIKVNEQNISLFMGSNMHLVLYPINEKNEFNLTCIIRNKVPNLENLKSFIKQKVLSQNPNLESLFNDKIRSWPLYSTKKILKPQNQKIFYIGDAFNGFLPTLAQGAGQSIESAYELYNLLKNDESIDASDIYFKKRLERVKIVRTRTNLNFFLFHLSSSLMRSIRNFFMKFLIKQKRFTNSYLGKVYKN